VTNLLDRTARYVGIPSVSRNERAIADEVEGALRTIPSLEVIRIGDNVVARTDGGLSRRIAVAGHLDTVPGLQGVEVRGDAVHGLGACDMKGSVAVMVDLATSGEPFACELTWIFYAREEIGREDSGLLEVAGFDPSFLVADVALVCEPTSCVVEAGCQGSVQLRLILRGARAHTARPWRGRNAIHRLAGPLAAIANYAPRSVDLDGVTYVEQRQVVGVTGGVAGNVVPDEAILTINQRVAPDRTCESAVDELRTLLEGFLDEGDAFEVMDMAPPGPPHLTHPVLARLIELSGAPPRAKLGYTDVATFAERGVPAANFGAGDPELAHHAGEFVSNEDLVRCRRVLAELLATPFEAA
jgi:succinyl-diaminopimelate desuccinylase